MRLRNMTRGIAVLIIGATATASAAELKVLGGSAVTPAMNELITKFEQAAGHRVLADFDGAIGAMADRVRRGEAPDVLIVSKAQIDLLEREGKVLADSRVDLAKVGVGVFVRKGAAKPDISSLEAFKEAMTNAKSIGYNDPAAGAPVSIYLLDLFERIGIARNTRAKIIVFKQRSERFEAVARGDVEIGFNQTSEIVAAEGVDLVGPLPSAIQRYTQFAAGIVANSKQVDASRAFVAFISSPEARAVWSAKGFEAP